MANYRTAPWFQGILLGGFCLVASVALATGTKLTAPAIARAAKADLSASLDQVIPAAKRGNDMTADTVVVDGPDGGKTTVYRARSGKTVSAVAYRVVGKGYGGDIVIVMGVDRSGEILGVRVVQHSETPGLGDKIDARKTDWVHGFDKLSAANTPDSKWAVKKDGGRFDQFSGATITPRAVVKAVKEGLDLFEANRAKMLGAEADDPPAATAPAPTAEPLPPSRSLS